MSTEIYNNFSPKIAAHLDQRLAPVATAANLPDSTVAANFMFDGALVYVIDEKTHYKLDLTTHTWSKVVTEDLQIGVLNILNSSTTLDLSLVSPAIELCGGVLINITGGNSATIQSFTNFPSDKKITFFAESGKVVNFVHTDYDVASVGQIVTEVGFNFALTGRLIGNDEVTFVKQDVAICQHSATQFMKSTQWAQNLLSIAIEDNLTSTSTSKALSVNQGRVLDGKIANKQDKLTAGKRISITGNVIDVAPALWKSLSNTASSGLIDYAALQAFLTGFITTVDPIDYRYIDLTYTNTFYPNWGVYCIPPGADPTVFGNWVKMSGEQRTVRHMSMGFRADGSLGASLTANKFFVRMLLNGKKGDTLMPMSFNTDGDPVYKVSAGFTSTGIYNIKGSVILKTTTASEVILPTQDILDNIAKLNLVVYVTDGVQSVALPSNTGVIVFKSNFHKGDYSLAGPDMSIGVNFDFTMVVDTLGVDSAFCFALEENSAAYPVTWDGIGVDNCSLNITKFK